MNMFKEPDWKNIPPKYWDRIANLEAYYPPLILSKEFYDRVNKGGVDEKENS